MACVLWGKEWKKKRKLAYVSATGNFIVHAKNTKADALSRFQMQKFQQLAPHADRRATLCQTPADLMMN